MATTYSRLYCTRVRPITPQRSLLQLPPSIHRELQSRRRSAARGRGDEARPPRARTRRVHRGRSAARATGTAVLFAAQEAYRHDARPQCQGSAQRRRGGQRPPSKSLPTPPHRTSLTAVCSPSRCVHRRQELSNSVSASPVKPVRRLPEPPSLSPALSRHTYPSEQFEDYDKCCIQDLECCTLLWPHKILQVQLGNNYMCKKY